MIAVALLAFGVVIALQTIAFSSKLSLYASELQLTSIDSLEWVDLNYQKGREEVLAKVSAINSREDNVHVKAFFDKDWDLSTPGFDTYRFKLEMHPMREGKEETIIVRSILVEKRDETQEKLGFDFN